MEDETIRIWREAEEARRANMTRAERRKEDRALQKRMKSEIRLGHSEIGTFLKYRKEARHDTRD